VTASDPREAAPDARSEVDKQRQEAASRELQDRTGRRPEFVIEIWASPQLREQNPAPYLCPRHSGASPRHAGTVNRIQIRRSSHDRSRRLGPGDHTVWANCAAHASWLASNGTP
jgi:hypothetical protein